MRVLLAVASRHGATREIACRVAAELGEMGVFVDVLDPVRVEGVEPYDAVVLGSAVYTGHWLPEARAFARRFEDDLARRPLWLFSSGLATTPAAAANSPAQMRELISRTGARGHRAFAGRLDLTMLSRTERAVIAAARARQGDHRDMEAVARWARGIGAELTATGGAQPLTGPALTV
ncbi:flavodoxin domain-containing protein [Cellulomonas sp. ATA003]|uniref:flavodoxin domain-containing protein n=1 Tax=Cellulomonas sp. ATA003 TaxID=3073064 RepID=UPI002872C037|nr:flavodoxin domain-containing protein [Cellulomonas sp. ATA003]WNB86227.1 flavodoxin domain-containing protein [Cellulomonas sp. ATA003]